MTPIQLTVFIIACLLIGLSKGGLGGPLPVSLVVPMLALVMDAREAVPLVLPFLIFADWFALRAYWKQWDIAYIKLMLPAGIFGIIVGGVLLSAVSETTLKIAIGIFTLIVIIYKLLSDRLESIEYKHHNWHGYLAGWTSAFASTLANTGGPPFTIYMLLQKIEPIPFIATTTLYFAIINALKLPIFWYQGLIDLELLLTVLPILPLLPLAVWVGRRSLNYISQPLFERIMMILLALSIVFLFATLR